MKYLFLITISIFIFLIIAFLFLRLSYNARRKQRTAFDHLNKITDLKSKDEDCPVSGHEEKLPEPANMVFVHSSLIGTFVEQHIEPYIQVLQHNGYYDSVLKVLVCLDRYGDCSSVVHDESESAYSRSEDLYTLLGKISLLEHSLNVANEIITIVNNGSFGQDSDMRRGMLLLTALGHDLGKIPKLHQKAKYATGDHAIMSRAELSGIMPDSVPERQKILDAVRDHHLKSEEFLTLMVKKADQQARAKEARAFLPPVKDEVKGHTTVPDTVSKQNVLNDKIPTKTNLSWLDIDVLKERIEEEINVLHKNKFSAFSMRDGQVYVMPELISSIVYNLAETENHLDIITESKRNIEHTVRALLKEYISPDIGPSYNGRRYNVYNNGKIILQGFYMPIKAEAFNVPISEMEKRKSGYLKSITKVEPAFFPPGQ